VIQNLKIAESCKSFIFSKLFVRPSHSNYHLNCNDILKHGGAKLV